MGKICMFLLLFVSVVTGLKAQTFSEWFRQNKTQKNYLTQQIAALRVYIEEGQKGYDIAREGLTRIGDFINGEFNLHTECFRLLKSVNPEILRCGKVPEIMSTQVRIIQNCNQTIRQLNSSDVLSGDERSYINRVFSRLVDDCGNILDELILITTNGQLKMKDGERLKRIDRLRGEMQDKLTFSQSFSNDAILLAVARIREQTDVQTGRVLQGIRNK